MCEILIKLADEVKADPSAQKGAWRTGDIFAVRPDGFKWGRDEKPPTFRVVKLPGVDVKDVEKVIGPWVDEDGAIYRMSAWQFKESRGRFIRKQDGLEKNPQDLRDVVPLRSVERTTAWPK